MRQEPLFNDSDNSFRHVCDLPEHLSHVGDPGLPYDLGVLKHLRVISKALLTLQVVTALHFPLFDGPREHILAILDFKSAAHHFSLGEHGHVPDHDLRSGVLVVDLKH